MEHTHTKKEEERTSFLKKRSKKLLVAVAGLSRARAKKHKSFLVLFFVTAQVGAKTGNWGIGPFSENLTTKTQSTRRFHEEAWEIPAFQGMACASPPIQIPFLREFLRVLCVFVVQFLAFFLGPRGMADLPCQLLFFKKELLLR
jgi:hypothetical protein